MPWDFLVIANPAWESARLVERIPEEPGPASGADNLAGEGGPSAVTTDGGGSALNTACALAMAGRRVLAIGRVGDDEPGRACLEALRRRGVETACEVLAGRTTKRNTCFVERATHATAFSVELPPRSVPPWEDTPAQLLDARILLLDRLAAAAPGWLGARTEALGKRSAETSPIRRHAGRDEAPINALVRNSAVLSPEGTQRFASALPHLGYLQMPEETGTETRPALPEKGRIHSPRSLPPLAAEEITAILATGVRLLVRTRGAHGVAVDSAEGWTVELPAEPTEVVDPTGGGDAFAAGFLDALLDRLGPAEAAQRGLDWAARACRHLGARAWLDHEPPPS
jgi:ribokinase